jgi:hypothetical protein
MFESIEHIDSNLQSPDPILSCSDIPLQTFESIAEERSQVPTLTSEYHQARFQYKPLVQEVSVASDTNRSNSLFEYTLTSRLHEKDHESKHAQIEKKCMSHSDPCTNLKDSIDKSVHVDIQVSVRQVFAVKTLDKPIAKETVINADICANLADE